MSKTLQLKILTALQDKLSGPLKKIRGASGDSAKAMKDLRDKLKGLEQTQKEVGRFRDLSKGLTDTSSKLKQAQDRVNELARNIKNTESPTAAMRREFQQATRTADGLKNKHSQQSQELQRLRSSLSGAGVSTKSLSQDERSLRDNISRTTEQLERQRKKLAEVAKQQRKLGEAREKMQRTQALAGSMAGAGAAGLGVAYGIKRVGGDLLAPGISYGSQISELQAVTRLDKDDERLDMLKNQARELGASTAFSATDVAAGQTFLARAGFTPEAIHSSMKDMLELALANGVDLARTADIASNISSAFKIDPEVEGNMGRVADVLSAVSARANVDLEMLGETMKYLGQAEGLDVTLEEAAAMAGLLGNIGIQSSQAGTTMRAMLNRLSAPAKEGAKAMKMLGLEVTDANGDMLKMPEILESVAKATEGMGNAERAAHFKSIFGVEAGSGMAELVKQQGMGALVTLIAELENATGENSRMAATRADNIGGDLKGLHSAWEEIGIGITDVNEGPLRELIQSLTGVIRSVGGWMKQNPELVATIAKVVAVVGILAAVGGTLLITMASILGPFAAMRYGMSLLTIKGSGLFSTLWGLGAKALPVLVGVVKSLSVALWGLGSKALVLVIGAVKSLSIALLTTPIGWAVMAIAAGALLIWKYWDPIKAFFLGLWDQVKAAFDDGIAGVARLLVNWSLPALFYKAFSATLSFLGVELPDNLYDAGSLMITGLMDGISSVVTLLKEVVLSLWSEVRAAFDGGLLGISELIVNWSPIGLFYQAFAAVLSYLGVELPGKFTEFGSMMMSGLVNGIKSMGSAVKNAVVDAADGAAGWFKEKLGIQSPSRVFMGFGENISEGAAIGIERKGGLALKAAQAMTAGLMAVSALSPAGASSLSMDATIPQIVTPQQERMAPVVNVAAPMVPVPRLDAPVLPAIDVNIPQIVLPQQERMAPVVNVAAPMVSAPTLDAPALPAIDVNIPQIVLPQQERMAPVVNVAAPMVSVPTLDAPALPAIDVNIPQIVTPQQERMAPVVNVAAPMVPVPTLDAPALPAIDVNIPQIVMPQQEALRPVVNITAPKFEQIKFDDRPPIPAQHITNQQISSQSQNQQVNASGDKIEIHIHAAPGQNEMDLARAVAAELDRREREKKAQQRSGLFDY